MRVLLKDFFSSEKQTIELAVDETTNRYILPTRDRPRGLYVRLGNDRVGLFAINNRLFISVNETTAEVLSHEIPVSYVQRGEMREIRINLGSDERRITYRSSRPVSTPFYSEEEEDADFGLWLYNVLGSEERRNIFIDSWANRVG